MTLVPESTRMSPEVFTVSFSPSASPGPAIVHRADAALIINADDWGRDADTTDRSLDCFLRGAVSSVSAMVFMEDSKRAASLAAQHSVDAGLHVNFTSPFSAPHCPSRLSDHQQKIARFLLSNRFAPVIYHPGLAFSFEYAFAAQKDEFERLYGVSPRRFDGHHHMHLCANVLRQELLPAGAVVRRNSSFLPGEKGFVNRLYRRRQDRKLAQRHTMADCFFSLVPLDFAHRIDRIFQLSTRFIVEIGTHPANTREYRFLTGGEISSYTRGFAVAHGYASLVSPGIL